jgi:ATP-dependent Lhr-like helicase
VVLHAGELVGWLGRSEQSLLTFLPAEEPERSRRGRALARALADLVDSGRRRALLVSRIDGEPAHASAFAPLLAAAGFAPGHKGYLKRAPLEVTGLRLRAGRGEPRGPLGPDLPSLPSEAEIDDAEAERSLDEG